MADLKTIIRLTHDELKRQVPVEQAVHDALRSLNAREAEVVALRNGLGGRSSQTLQQIGEAFGITRERVRQIENQGLKKFQGQLTERPLRDIVALVTEALREHGGIISRERMLTGFLPAVHNTAGGQQALAFLLCRLPEALLAPSDRLRASFYARSSAHVGAVGQIIPALRSVLEQAAEPLRSPELLSGLADSPAAHGVSYLLDQRFVEATLEIGRSFVPCAGDTWGLVTWPDINPRNIREKTLYVLKASTVPLHFKDITDRIRDARFDAKRVTVQAVHNELINGEEFILIGRGIYALRDWGYLPGTVAEVITAILAKASGPLDREEIVRQVLKQRHVSRNTILINLQEKRLFTRTARHAYTTTVPAPASKAQAAAELVVRQSNGR